MVINGLDLEDNFSVAASVFLGFSLKLFFCSS